MGKLGIFNDERSKWIQFDEDTEVLVRFIGRQELRKMQRKAEKTANLIGVDVNDILNQKLGRAAVLGWRKMNDHKHPGLIIKDQPLPYTPENIDMLMTRSLEFSKFVNDNAVDSKLFLEEEKETEETKNVS